ncbi:MAG TPA: polynucleotide adenylyltransferase PcnB [Thermoanaerobaculia bacterium]|nr:polynucleotide adenylyltransferase PcnB [Thermoanaerobaculia bacterium]
MSEGTSEPRVLPRPEHPISRKDISPNALKVLYRLHQRGYKAYLVGGSVRDLMLGRRPKDFDIGTDASPQEVRRLFRNSRIIGRRFRLVHVVFEGEIIEVSTFRGAPEPGEAPIEAGVREAPPGVEIPDDLLVTSDNTFGTPREDAFRRDFTVNALFYDIDDFSVIDWVGGIDDLQRRLIRVIGDPDVRLQEDPVRMMRACEYAGRLSFGIDPATQESIQRHRQKLELASPVRVTEEILQLLRCGHAGAALQWMLELGLLEVLLPEAYAMVGGGAAGVGDFGRLLPTVDGKVQQGRALSDAALLAVLVLPKVLQRRDDIEAVERRPMSRAALRQLVDETVAPFATRLALSRARASQLNHALVAFHRLCEPGWAPRGRAQMARRPYFDDGLALFELMVEATGDGGEPLAAWQAAAQQRGRIEELPPPDEPVAAGAAAAGEAPGARRSRRRRRRRRGRGGGAARDAGSA